MKSLYLFLIFIFSSFYTFCKTWDYSYTHYGKIDGLPSNKIYCMCNDRDGFLWIGTDAGLCKFDGSKFELYTTEDGLPSDDVFELFCDSKNRLWITTMSNEISYYNRGIIFNKRNDEFVSKIMIPSTVSRIVEDESGSIWVLAYPFVINKISTLNKIEKLDFGDKYGYCYKVNLTQNGVIVLTSDYSLLFDKSMNIIATNRSTVSKKLTDFVFLDRGLFIYSDSNGKLRKKVPDFKNSHYYTQFHAITLFKADSSIWQLSSKGIKAYSQNNLSTSTLFLKNYSVSNFVVDKYKKIWVSTLYNGLFKLNSTVSKVFKPNDDEATNSIHSVLVTDKNIIIGNNNGEITIIEKSKKENIWKIKINENAVLSFRILKLLVKGDVLIICSDIGTYTYNFNSRIIAPIFPKQSCKNIFLENDSLIILNNVAVNYFDKGFIKRGDLTVNHRFFSHCLYNNKKIFGSENTLYYEGDSLIEYPLDRPFHYRLMDMKVVDSFLVIATTEKGVFFIHNHTVVRNVNMSNGLNSNNCAKVIPYKDELFIATNNGICRYNYHENTMSRIMESDGLASNNVLDVAIDNDTLYAGTDNGLTVMPLISVMPQKTFSFFINPVIANKDTVWDVQHKVKSRTDHSLTILLNAISLGVKGEVKYYYRIKEKDTNYILTSDPKVMVNLIKPGLFTFEAFSIDVNGLKSVTATLQIDVVPYWWQTSLFIWGCVFLFLLFLFGVYRIMNAVIRKREQIKNEMNNRITKLELDAWKSNINPHFMFNSFNTIQSLFTSSQYEKANEFIAQFSGILRKTIDNSSRLMNRYSEEISYLENYLELERIKKKNKLTFQIYYNQQELDAFYVPSLLIQPIIENSIKHGVKQLRNGHIVVEFVSQQETITVTVRDNGVGLPEKDRNYTNSKGLKLVRDKIRIVENITNRHIDFRIENVYDSEKNCLGVMATFVLPKYTIDYHDAT